MRAVQSNSVKVQTIHLSSEHPFLKDHRVSGMHVLPGAAYLKIALDFAKALYPDRELNSLENVSWIAPLVCTNDHIDVNLHMQNTPERIVFSFEDIMGKLYSSGSIVQRKCDSYKVSDIANFSHDFIVPRNEAYHEFEKLGISYGQFFNCLKEVKVKDNFGLAEINSDNLDLTNLLDCSFQSGMAITLRDNFPNLMPITLGNLECYQDSDVFLSDRYFAFTEKVNRFRTNIIIMDGVSNVIVRIKDLGIKPGKF